MIQNCSYVCLCRQLEVLCGTESPSECCGCNIRDTPWDGNCKCCARRTATCASLLPLSSAISANVAANCATAPLHLLLSVLVPLPSLLSLLPLLPPPLQLLCVFTDCAFAGECLFGMDKYEFYCYSRAAPVRLCKGLD